MINAPIDYFLYFGAAVISLGLLGGIYRIIKGPTPADRLMALDTIGINLISMTALICMILRTSAYLTVILLVGILAFIETVSIAKFIERGVVLERKRNH
ncbi:cation:proton antiporter [Alkalihalobacillus alcalophilus ATCC 27647 = CGMCC 1.3604]|uniref:Cation:proton antiporter n=1 Tax=Alkalihalobacillus alcalophilus ATCC 27647 = CGMCC 1.3604 TaxID=1218173 RepID=J8TNM8_ALKAL|nr:Na(+)/H(+) antiporter subunit F1 [Alkalihalobacillus alcalophilus]AFV25928.1 multicomponent sodium ion:proton antiporter transporter [Alkalihalobacillus alcalophilus ATCC 27647 = CGMCC 1.3604]MED1562915.1 Na(+)/H(+) antiporter subunit F1 [Alkalihalobacillus alcalophilus]THG91728.1 cation:proton antiporter [Alkalihalobacillus alcalophilus ATCC 27647 = CGMCC 1.3604]